MAIEAPGYRGVMGRIYLSAPDVGVREEELCVAALRSGWVAPLGPMVDAFEEALADRCARRYAVALSSGTAALHLALLELGAGPQDVVVVPTMTFAATANAVVYTGATPVFVDCDPHFGNLDPDLLDGALRSLRREGRRVAAVIAVDLLGHCADYSQIEIICQSAGVPLLSDAAEALGASRAGRPAGSFGIAAILSFNGNKVISTSGGGALLTDDERFAERVRYLSAQARQPVAHYEHTEIGYNYRLSNVLAALGLAQLERLEEMIARRRRLREGYSRALRRHRGREDLPEGVRRRGQLLADRDSRRFGSGGVEAGRTLGHADCRGRREPSAVEAHAPTARIRRRSRVPSWRRRSAICSRPCPAERIRAFFCPGRSSTYAHSVVPLRPS